MYQDSDGYEITIKAETPEDKDLGCITLLKLASEKSKNAGEMTVCKLIEEDANVKLQVEGNWTAPWEAKHKN